MINVLLVDDEPLALDVLSVYLEEEFADEVQIVGKAKNALEANDLLQTCDVDLMFLDIQMPQLSGLDFLKILQNPPLTIVTTAFSEFAVEGYELDLVDFLLKPYSKERFKKAMDRALEILQNKIDEEEPEFIFIKSDKKYLKVFYDDIYYIEGLKDYVIIKTNEKRLISLQTMKGLEKRLLKHNFTRVHRSYIVNQGKIQTVTGNSLELNVGTERMMIPIGKSYRDNIQDLIQKNTL